MIKGLLLAVFVYSSSFPSLASDQMKYLIGDMTVERLLSQYPSFQSEYDRYQVNDQLDLSDPVRTNLRDASGNTVMGGFGAMAGNTIFFEVISVDSLLGL